MKAGESIKDTSMQRIFAKSIDVITQRNQIA